MKRNTWKYSRVVLTAVGFVGALVSCNSHLLLQSGDPEVVVIYPTDVASAPTVVLDDAGLPSGTSIFGVDPLKDGSTANDPPPTTNSDATGPDAAKTTPDAAKIPDAGPDLGPDLAVEDLKCPSGTVRVHVRDVWSTSVDPPSLKTLTSPPSSVLVIDPSSWATYGARQDSANCTYYSVCLATTITKIMIKAVGPDSCPVGNQSGTFDLSSFKNVTDIWIEHLGKDDSTIQQDYSNATVGTNAFHLTSDAKTLTHPACDVGTPPDETIPTGYTKVHFRWPWNDPTDPATPYPGSACPLDFATTMGFTVPPYPSSLKVTGLTCEMVAVLEFEDSSCPWYYVMIPDSAWPTSGTSKSIVFRYPDESKKLYTNGITLPLRSATTKEYWIAYAGAPDNTIASTTKCQDWSLQTNSYFIYTSNPGPGYTNCGGSVTTPDPCSPLQPSGYHTVHFRYLWAGQKTFTFFPKVEMMPKWIELEVNGTTALKVICQREQDRPWFECPVPDTAFSASTTWRAVDKLHNPEWNTVKPWPLPEEPKEYWIRWYYGKPDIPRSVDPPNFKVFDYYPDGTNGDWSATGDWNDSACAPKPPATPVTVGFGNGAWFPYKATEYKYSYGGSLAYLYSDSSTVQDLFNGFVWERYNLWKQNWVKYDSDACGTGTARVHSDTPEGTVSEGQGYGIAIAAAIGDKELVGKLWEFVRHFRSEKKYCSLMGWIWTDSNDCLAADESGKGDSAFDGDVDIAIGLVYAAMQWPSEYNDIAIAWLQGMECEINAKYGDGYNYPTNGDSWDKSYCTADKCEYAPKTVNSTYVDYFPPGYFRAFGDFLADRLGSTATATNGQTYHDFWYKTAETVWELVERCYDVTGVHPGLMGDMGHIDVPCSSGGGEPYEWGRALWRLAIDAAWFGNNTKDLPENQTNSSTHYGPKSRIQAKMDNIQDFYTNFYKKNPPETNANRFSTICHQLGTDGTVTDCDPAYGHNSYTVNLAMCPYATSFNDGGATTLAIRKEAIEESISTTVQNDHYFQESLGVYSILFLTGNFPNPMTVSAH
jgi:hypothetical protein